MQTNSRNSKEPINGEGQPKVFIEHTEKYLIEEVAIDRVPDYTQKVKTKVSDQVDTE